MQVYIASNDPAVTEALQAGLQHLGVECPATRVVAHESIPLLTLNTPTHRTRVIFFASQKLGSDEFEILRQLCSEAGDLLKIVVVGADLSPSAILQAIRCGASDCLDINRNLKSELGEVLRRFTASRNGSHTRRLFSVIGSGGGAGATLVAVNVAAALAARSFEVGLLDLHVRGGDAATFLNCAPRHTLASLAAKNDQFDLAMFEQSLIKHDSGIHLLASPEMFSDFRTIRRELIPRVVQFARHVFSHVVVDLEDCEHDEQLRILAASERVIHVVRSDFISVHRARKLCEFLSRAKMPRDHVTLVANRLGTPKALTARQIEEALGMSVHHRFPDEPEAVNASVNLGVPLVLARPKAKVSQAIAQLTDSLVGGTASPVVSWPRRQIVRLTDALTRQKAAPLTTLATNAAAMESP
jgi:pilus assembly protein CpaE